MDITSLLCPAARPSQPCCPHWIPRPKRSFQSSSICRTPAAVYRKNRKKKKTWRAFHSHCDPVLQLWSSPHSSVVLRCDHAPHSLLERNILQSFWCSFYSGRYQGTKGMAAGSPWAMCLRDADALSIPTKPGTPWDTASTTVKSVSMNVTHSSVLQGTGKPPYLVFLWLPNTHTTGCFCL